MAARKVRNNSNIFGCHVLFSELLITKEEPFAAMLDLYGDWSHYVSGECLDSYVQQHALYSYSL